MVNTKKWLYLLVVRTCHTARKKKFRAKMRVMYAFFAKQTVNVHYEKGHGQGAITCAPNQLIGFDYVKVVTQQFTKPPPCFTWFSVLIHNTQWVLCDRLGYVRNRAVKQFPQGGLTAWHGHEWQPWTLKPPMRKRNLSAAKHWCRL